MVETTENYLNITEPYRYDNSVQKIKLVFQDPDRGTDIYSSIPIQIVVQPNDTLLLPSRSYLYVEGSLLKKDGTRFQRDPQDIYQDIALTNNFFPYMFKNIKYTLNDTEIESFNYPGQCTTIKHLLTKSKSFEGTSMGWNIDTYDGSAKYNEYMFYPLRYFTISEFAGADPPTKATLKVFALNFIPMFQTINNASQVVQFTDVEYDTAVTGDPVTTAMIIALATLITDKLNLINEIEVPYLVIGDIPGVSKQNIVDVFNKISKNFNTTVSRDTYGVKVNRGFMARKDLIFNPQGRVNPPFAAGNFSFIIPLSYLFNFCETYDKVIYNCKHQIELSRDQTDDYAIFKSRLDDDDGIIRLSMLRWYIPSIVPNEENKIMLYKTIRDKVDVDLAFMNKKIDIFNDLNDKSFYSATINYSNGIEKPRYIIAAFQSYDKTQGRTDDLQNVNFSIFNNNSENARPLAMIDLRYVNVYINGESYQLMDYNNAFFDNRFGRWYNEYRKFRMSYMNDFTQDDIVTYEAFRDLYRLYVFDISKQSEQITNGVANVRLEFNFNGNTPSSADADVKLYCVSFYDRIWKLASDGTKQYIIK